MEYKYSFQYDPKNPICILEKKGLSMRGVLSVGGKTIKEGDSFDFKGQLYTCDKVKERWTPKGEYKAPVDNIGFIADFSIVL